MKISNETQHILHEKGYSDLNEYLTDLADEYTLKLKTVQTMARFLGEEELFDGLLTTLEDVTNELL